jgi:hypothetical protein
VNKWRLAPYHARVLPQVRRRVVAVLVAAVALTARSLAALHRRYLLLHVVRRHTIAKKSFDAILFWCLSHSSPHAAAAGGWEVGAWTAARRVCAGLLRAAGIGRNTTRYGGTADEWCASIELVFLCSNTPSKSKSKASQADRASANLKWEVLIFARPLLPRNQPSLFRARSRRRCVAKVTMVNIPKVRRLSYSARQMTTFVACAPMRRVSRET